MCSKCALSVLHFAFVQNNVYAMCQVLEAKAPGVSFIKPKVYNFVLQLH